MSELKQPMTVAFTGERNRSNLKYDENHLGNKDLYFGEARYEFILVLMAYPPSLN